MQGKDLKIFDDMPFFFWVKDEKGRYMWANQALRKVANKEMIGKTDDDFMWSGNAASFQSADQKVQRTGDPIYHHERANLSSAGPIDLNVCKFIGDFEGKRCVFGISFSID